MSPPPSLLDTFALVDDEYGRQLSTNQVSGMPTKTLGLLQAVSPAQRIVIEEQVQTSFDDINAAVEEVKWSLYDLRCALDRILYGE